MKTATDLVVESLISVHGLEAVRARFAAQTYCQPHTHVCGGCSVVLTHSRLDALLIGLDRAHRCPCGRDLRT